MIIAGEASGDLLGAGLIKAIKEQQLDVQFCGVAGAEMQAQGMKSLFDMQELSIMGIAEVLPHIPHMIKRIHETVAYAKEQKIDALVTIDSPDFCLRVAKKIKKELGIPCIHYVSPSIWAWRRGRAKKMAEFLDHVLLLFPFESQYYAPHNLKTTFVGHPVTQRGIPVAHYNNEPILALLPGSRKKVIERMLPEMVAAFNRLKQDIPNLKGIIPLVSNKHKVLIEDLIPNSIDIVIENRFAKLAECRAALATSGTSNLELAVAKIPMVITYAVSSFTYLLTQILADIPYASPVNWVLNEGKPFSEGVPELLQDEATAENMYQKLLPLLQDSSERKTQLETLEKTISKLSAPRQGSSEKAAETVLSYITN